MSLLRLDHDIRELADVVRENTATARGLGVKLERLDDAITLLQLETSSQAAATRQLAAATERLAAAVEKITEDPPMDRPRVSFHLIGPPRPKEG